MTALLSPDFYALMTSLYHLFELGGWVMYAIAFGAWTGLAVFLLKMWQTRKAVVIPNDYVQQTLRLANKGELSAALSLAKDEHVAGRLTRVALESEAGELDAVLEESGRREITRLAQYNGILATVASISPLLGLLGTVLGLIAMFQSLGDSGQTVTQISADVMADGIWKAMLTTAWGLTVAIPALLASKWIHARVEHRATQLEDFSSQLARMAQKHRGEQG